MCPLGVICLICVKKCDISHLGVNINRENNQRGEINYRLTKENKKAGCAVTDLLKSK